MQYAAFLSYSSIDRAIGERVQTALESFVVPSLFRGQDFGRGPVPKRIAPIFRDRWDANASTDLAATLQAALQASSALIVLCSPAAAKSIWVGEEIRTFKRAGRGDRIYPVLVSGLPTRFDPDRMPQGAFPPALFGCWDEAGKECAPDDRVPLAPDARPEGDGLHFTILKLVAALTAIPLTTLTQRQAEAERRERNNARWVAGAMSVLALGAAIGAWTSWRATDAARARLGNAVEMASRRVDDAASFHDRYGVPSKVIHELLYGAQKDFDELTQGAPDTPMLRLQRARLDRLFAQLYESAGDGTRQEAMANRAFNNLENVPTQRLLTDSNTWLAQLPPLRNVKMERILAQEALGQARAAKGDLPGARSAFQAMANGADALVRDYGDAATRMLAANARSHLARLSYDSGNLEAALHTLRDATNILTTNPLMRDTLGDLAKIQSDEAEMLLELGRHTEALKRQRLAVDTLEKERHPTPEARRTLAAALARRGDMRLAALRDLKGAHADYLQAQLMLVALLAEDGARTDIKRDLSLTYERKGDALLQASDIAGAAEAFATCLKLRRELLARDQSNAEWRRDLSVALERMGDVDSLRAKHDAASASFKEALRLREAALIERAGDQVATRDLAVLWMRQGKALADARASRSEIDAAYTKAINLLTPLVEHSPPAARGRRDLAVAYAERGQARHEAVKLTSASADFETALKLIIALRIAAPEDTQLQQDEAWLRHRLKR